LTLGLSLLDAGAAHAYVVTVAFEGEVTDAEMNAGLFGPSVQIGDPFTGHFRYELFAPDQQPGNNALGFYDAIEWVIDGSPVALTNPTIRVEIGTQSEGIAVVATGGTYANGIILLLAGPPGTLGFDFLPASLELTDFVGGRIVGSKGALSLDPQIPSTFVWDRGTLTQLAPEASGLEFAALAGLLFVGLSRRRAVRSWNSRRRVVVLPA
jgi:hypothetical protein